MDVDHEDWMSASEAIAWIVTRDPEVSLAVRFAGHLSLVSALLAWRKVGNAFSEPIDAGVRHLAHECEHGRVQALGRKVDRGFAVGDSSPIPTSEWRDAVLLDGKLMTEHLRAELRRGVVFKRGEILTLFPGSHPPRIAGQASQSLPPPMSAPSFKGKQKQVYDAVIAEFGRFPIDEKPSAGIEAACRRLGAKTEDENEKVRNAYRHVVVKLRAAAGR